jgi:DNA-binding winged helix-turn-helix (wHTH) protein
MRGADRGQKAGLIWLAEHRAGLVRVRCWFDTAVEENNLTVQISALRRVLDQGRTHGSCIQTIPGRGYRFVGAVPDPSIPEVAELRLGAVKAKS